MIACSTSRSCRSRCDARIACAKSWAAVGGGSMLRSGAMLRRPLTPPPKRGAGRAGSPGSRPARASSNSRSSLCSAKASASSSPERAACSRYDIGASSCDLRAAVSPVEAPAGLPRRTLRRISTFTSALALMQSVSLRHRRSPLKSHKLPPCWLCSP